MTTSHTPTTRVRIAVCVDVDGYYCAFGERDPYGLAHDNTSVIFAEDNYAGENGFAPQHIVWVEADVPLPKWEGLVVEGEVTP